MKRRRVRGARGWLTLATVDLVTAALTVSLVTVGCGGPPLPVPVREPPCKALPCHAAHEGEDPIPVPFPPPPAKVDVIGDPPTDLSDPVWVDGQWEWRGRAWVWAAGKWWARPPSRYWAAPALVRRGDGQLVWFAGSFRPFDGDPGAPAPGGLPSSTVPREKGASSP